MWRTNLANVIPPPQTNKEAASDVFHRPKVEREQENHHYGDKDVVRSEDPAEDVHEQRQRLEEQVEDLKRRGKEGSGIHHVEIP